MKINITKEWLDCQPNSDDTVEIAAGPLSLDSLKEEAAAYRNSVPHREALPLAFGRLIQFARLERGWSIDVLAREAEIDIAELRLIESFSTTPAGPRTVFQLKRALRLGIPDAALQILAGHAVPTDTNTLAKAERFAAQSLSLDRLSPEQLAMFHEFVKALAER